MNAKNNISKFLNDFEQYGNKLAIIWKYASYSYSHIITRIDYWQSKLNFIESGTIVGLEGDFSPEAISILFVLISKNSIIVPLDINHSSKNEKKYEIAQIQVLIRIKSENDIEFISKISITPLNTLFKLLKEKDVPGLVLFTSGSSGEPKGAIHDFSKLLSKFEIKRNALCTINFLLFDHWGGLNTLFHILSNGGTVVILENRMPEYVCELIEKYKVELLPTSPTFLNMLILSRAYERKDISSLKIISYGSEPMPENLLKHLNLVFPNIKLQQTYGLIELGVMRSKSEENGSLWVKIGGDGYQTRIVDGILQVKSDSAMLGYLNAESPFTNDGWFITGDSVEVKGEYLKILGRKSEIINVGGEKVFPQEIENVILEIPEISDVMVYGEDNRFTGKIVCAKIFYQGAKEKSEIIKEIKIHCRTHLQQFKIPMKFLFVDKSFENDRYKKTRNINLSHENN
jgi:long-chain acyl-CoA synthetase